MNGFDSYQLQRRSVGARGILGLAFLILAGAFFRVQVVEHERYQLKAETNRLRPVAITAPRGSILDYKGQLIAENVPGYSVKLISPSIDSLSAVLSRISRVVPLDSGDVRTILARYRQARYQPAVVFGDADFATVSKLEEHRALLPGMVIQSEPKRLYPAGRAVAHLVGYVSEVNEDDLSKNRYAGAELGTIVGKAGLERQYDDTLRGTEGVRYIEVNARGRVVREEAPSATLLPTTGKPIRTTIDIDLQRYIDSIWPAGRRGAMIAMTPDGQIRALYSSPSYDPNIFVGGIDPQDWRGLNTDSAKPLLNRAIIGRYPPASPFKLAIAAMALRRGLVDFGTHMPLACRGGMQLGNRYFKCWKKEGHGNLDLTGAVAASCDVYFYQVGLRLGLEPILHDGVLLGFKDKSGIDLPSEQSPIYPATIDYYTERYGPRGWSAPAVTMNLSIGQGENTQTLINMMKFYQSLAGDGLERQPYIVNRPTKAPRSLGLNDAQLLGLRRSLAAVVERGTAAGGIRAALGTTVLDIAGKTGTAQNPHGKDHGWFIGFAPVEHPKLIVGGIMEFAEHGTVVVPYVARTLARYVLGAQAANAVKTDLHLPVDSAPRPVELGDTVRVLQQVPTDSASGRAPASAPNDSAVPHLPRSAPTATPAPPRKHS
jgi:penicillin-binding protein 2